MNTILSILSILCSILLGSWILMVAKAYRRDKIMGKFEDWIYRECGLKKQTSYNFRNLYKCMSVAPELMNCRVNTTYFVKNHEILLNYFEENEEQIPRKHEFYCT